MKKELSLPQAICFSIYRHYTDSYLWMSEISLFDKPKEYEPPLLFSPGLWRGVVSNPSSPVVECRPLKSSVLVVSCRFVGKCCRKKLEKEKISFWLENYESNDFFFLKHSSWGLERVWLCALIELHQP
ncbi:hypothetical protein IF1G_03137 [Cordyceps javanica]|uniref:Uncharacterized protein n=1 Tax=Cordyceps javanica TaxID=43265 RepID=A0A545V6R9_9HYPO|nr:hypothetical protein IF1G_03137 [Cordyceps javanica]